MLKQRIMTTLVLFPVVLILLLVTPIDYFVGAIIVICYLIALEWAKLAGFKKSILQSCYALTISAINLAVWYFSSNSHFWPSLSWPQHLVWDLPLVMLTVSVIGVAVSMFIVVGYSRLSHWWANKAIVSIMGLALLPGFFVALVSIRNVESIANYYHGGQLVLMMFCLIWAADSGAYFAGKNFGRRKLAPMVSPNKTWEGALGGVILSFVIGWSGALMLNLKIDQPMVYSLVLLSLAVVSVFGDLFESALKRSSGIKDSGNLLPGHGGVLDRLDSTIVVAPLFYLSFSYFGWI